ncbi:hypothetical protein DFJ74DRAFT_472801 [Hyaloraphidium curvatum]|nr:hypothetical protein DFJ74DRAFT_472801 [Hyaloraphidium curvatum]
MPCAADNNACQIFFSIAAPLCGNVLAFALNAAPLRGVLHIQRTKDASHMNPAFSLMMVPTSLVGLGYGLVLENWWICVPNLLAFPLGLFYSVVLLKFAAEDRFTYLALFLSLSGFLAAFLVALCMVQFFRIDPELSDHILGISSTVILIAMDLAPLTSLPHAISHRDASGIYIPVALGLCVNCAFWLMYGAFLGRIFVWLPNVFGIASGLAQVVVALAFSRRGKRSFMTVGRRRLWRTLGRWERDVEEAAHKAVEHVDKAADVVDKAADVVDKAADVVDKAADVVDKAADVVDSSRL